MWKASVVFLLVDRIEIVDFIKSSRHARTAVAPKHVVVTDKTHASVARVVVLAEISHATDEHACQLVIVSAVGRLLSFEYNSSAGFGVSRKRTEASD